MRCNSAARAQWCDDLWPPPLPFLGAPPSKGRLKTPFCTKRERPRDPKLSLNGRYEHIEYYCMSIVAEIKVSECVFARRERALRKVGSFRFRLHKIQHHGRTSTRQKQHKGMQMLTRSA